MLARIVRTLTAAFVALVATLPAQSVSIGITPPSSNTAIIGPINVTIEWCAVGASLYEPDRTITFNSQNVVNSFTWTWSTNPSCDSYATSTGTITLVSGLNRLVATIPAYYEPPPPPPECPPICDSRPTRPMESVADITAVSSDAAPPRAANSPSGVDWVSGSNEANWTASPPFSSVAVTPDGTTASSRPPSAGPFTEAFTVRNTGNVSNTFTLTCGATAPLTSSCTPSPGSVNLAPNATANVTATYTTTASLGTGALTLTATGSGASDAGSYNVPVIVFGVDVTPDYAYGSVRLAAGQPGYHESPTSELFKVRNTGSGPQTYEFSVASEGPELGTFGTPDPITLAAGDSATVGVLFDPGSEAGVQGLRLTAWNTYASDDGVIFVTIQNMPGQGGGLIEAAIFPSSTAVGIRTFLVQVHTCTRTGIAYPVTWTFKLNGVDIASQFEGPYASEHPDCWQTTGGDPVPQMYLGTVTLQLGVNEFSVQGLDSGQFPQTGGATVHWTVPISPIGVVVTREAQYVEVPPSTLDTLPFRVRNVAVALDSFDLAAVCAGAAAGGGCATSASRVVLSPNAEAVVNVVYTSRATIGDSGSVQLTATRVEGPHVSDTTFTEITIVAAPAPGVALFGSGALIERDLCVTVALGSDAASECGDLRLAHALPVTRTLNRAWSPTLIYNSQHASPFPIVQADVTLPAGTTDSVEAFLKVGAQERGRGRWPGWPAGHTRHIAVADTTGVAASGLAQYTLEVRRKSGTWSTFATPTVTVPIVRRDLSNFGAGWWLAGLERLDSLAAANKVWTGGDGSMRRYVAAGANTWAAANVDHPDTLKLEGGFYVRYLPNNLRVTFDGTGKHVQTINRLNHITSFEYDACGRLSKITPPPDPTRFYQFTYESAVCTTRLTTVTAPPLGSTPRVVTVTTSSGRVQAIQDPDTSVVAFEYDTGTNRVRSRTNRRNQVTTYTYDAGKRVSGFQLPVWSSPVALKAAETRGLQALGAAPPLDSAFAAIDGPRSDVSDITRFWVNQYGAPLRTRNAAGGETVVTYDATWPALPKRVRGPNRFTTDAFYNARALSDSTKAWNPLGDSRNAVSKYFWHPVWFMPDTVITPSGVRTKFGYDASGNRIWQQLGTNSARRVTYTFNAQGQVTSVLAPLSAPDSLFYDATLGNLRKTKSPLGHLTLVYTDAIGRDTLSASNPRDTIPSDSANIRNNGVRVRTVYDIVDQVRKSITWSGPVTVTAHRPGLPDTSRTLPADTIRLEHVYDKEGNVLSTTRNYSAPNTSGLYALTSSWTYDDANRRVTSSSPSGGTTIDSLDAAGNAIAVTTPRNFKIRSVFDAMGRPVRRITPQASYGNSTQLNPPSWYAFPFRDGPGLCVRADTAVFVYDDAGQMIQADNWAARVARSYTPSGLQTVETQTIRTYMPPGQHPCEPMETPYLTYGSSGFSHIYQVRATYDLDGRRDTLVHPHNLCANCRDRYSYEPETGFLSQVQDVRTALTTFSYDIAGRLTTVVHPGGSGITRSQTYDVEGRVRTRSSPWISDEMWYDAAGRVVRADVTAAVGQQRTPQMIYGPMGSVVFSTGLSDAAAFEEFDPDAIGNRLWQRDYGFNAAYTDRRRELTHDGYGRLIHEADLPPAPVHYDLDRTTSYDPAGNVASTHGWERKEPMVTVYDETRSYYSADEKLAAFNRHVDQGPVSGPGGVFEQYRYDALGRRVFVRSRLTTNCAGSSGGACGYAQRTVWDGSQVLYEIRAPGGDTPSLTAYIEQDGYVLGGPDEGQFGIVGYTHAGGIDQPLAIHHQDVPGVGSVSIVPHANWQGDYAFGTKADGTVCATDCYQINWPGGRASADGEMPAGTATWWWGSLIGHQGDGSGLQYMRNRYYDPKTGRFTQEDPIGLAGGMNLYGFAGGDPISFDDPFGLTQGQCPDRFKNFTGAQARCALAGIGRAAVPIERAVTAAWTVESALLPMGGGGVTSRGVSLLAGWRAGRALADEAARVGRSLLRQEGDKILTANKHVLTGSRASRAVHDFGKAGLEVADVATAVADDIGDLSKLAPGFSRGAVEVGGRMVGYSRQTLETGETIVNFWLKQ